MGAGVGYKRLSPTLCHSPPTPASRFNLIGRARERPGETHGGGGGGMLAGCISFSSLPPPRPTAVLFGSGSESRGATTQG